MKILDLFKNKIEETGFSLLPDGIFTLEQDGRIVDVNDKVLEFYNTTRFNIIGHYFSDFIENGTSILNRIVQDKTYARVRAIDKFNNFDNGEDIFFEISASRIPDDKVYVCARNITDKHIQEKIINEKYSATQKIVDGKNDFLLYASDSILSSLVSLNGFSRALLDGIGGQLSEKQEKYLNIINNSSKELTYDLEKLFTSFKIESKKIEYEYKNFNLIALIKSIKRVYQKDLKDRNIDFNFDYSNLTQRDCYLDPEAVEYVLRCVMDIFLRFATLGKCSLNVGHPPIDFLNTREFKAKRELESTKYALFEAKIEDLVFSQDELDNIFNVYYKSSQKRPIGLKATLNILKSYICDFGGDIWIYSKQNAGTLFTFVLPLK